MCLLLKSCFAGGVKRQSEHLPCCANVWYSLLLEILWRVLWVWSVFFLLRASAARRYQAMQRCRAITLKQGNNFHLSEMQRAEGGIHCFCANCCAERSPLMLRDVLLLYPLCMGGCASFPSCTLIPHTGSGKVWPEPHIDLVWMQKGRSHRLSQRKAVLSDTLIWKMGKITRCKKAWGGMYTLESVWGT